MKNLTRIFLVVVATFFLLAWTVAAQEAQPSPEPNPEAQVAPPPPAPQAGPARTPRAYGDKDGDGICDTTGQPVGRGQAAGGQGRGQRLRQNRQDGAPAPNGSAWSRGGRRGPCCKGACDRPGRGRGRGRRN